MLSGTLGDDIPTQQRKPTQDELFTALRNDTGSIKITRLAQMAAIAARQLKDYFDLPNDETGL